MCGTQHEFWTTSDTEMIVDVKRCRKWTKDDISKRSFGVNGVAPVGKNVFPDVTEHLMPRLRFYALGQSVP